MDRIVKVGLACLRSGEILLVRKRGSTYFILPGGKLEAGESDIMALSRELEEELGCQLDHKTIHHIGVFSDVAAGIRDTQVTIRLYSADLLGFPLPKSEIEELAWVPLGMNTLDNLAPSLRNHIMPFLDNHLHRQIA